MCHFFRSDISTFSHTKKTGDKCFTGFVPFVSKPLLESSALSSTTFNFSKSIFSNRIIRIFVKKKQSLNVTGKSYSGFFRWYGLVLSKWRLTHQSIGKKPHPRKHNPDRNNNKHCTYNLVKLWL